MKQLIIPIAVLLIMLSFFVACDSDEGANTQNDTMDSQLNTDNDNKTLFDLELTEREIAFVEDLTEKDFETLTPEDLKIYKTISVVGDHVLFGEYFLNASPTSYAIEYDEYDIGPDYSDCVYLLQYFPELKNVSIYFHNTLTDVSFLKNIEKLEELTLYGTRVEDLTVLKNHPNFKSLYVNSSPLSKLEFHPDAKLDSLSFFATFFGDLSVIKGQHQMTFLAIYESLVPITNTQILAQFDSLDSLVLIAPECDYSFFEDMRVPISSVTLGGHDNIDLTVLSTWIEEMTVVRLYYSDGTDLTILDKLPDDCHIKLNGCNSVVRGEKTAESSECLKENSDATRMLHYFKTNFPELLPDEFK